MGAQKCQNIRERWELLELKLGSERNQVFRVTLERQKTKEKYK